MSDILRIIIGCYKDIFKVPALSDTVLLQSFAQTALVIDEVCKEVRNFNKRVDVTVCKHYRVKRVDFALMIAIVVVVQGLVEYVDTASLQKALAFKVRTRSQRSFLF